MFQKHILDTNSFLTSSVLLLMRKSNLLKGLPLRHLIQSCKVLIRILRTFESIHIRSLLQSIIGSAVKMLKGHFPLGFLFDTQIANIFGRFRYT